VTTRKLASIRRIAAIEPIEGADKIELITVDGWKCISNKDWVKKVGDLVVYFEVDAFLPVRPEFEFLRKSSFKSTTNLGDGFRIKTMKMRGQLSQGLILPLEEVIPHGNAQPEGVKVTEDGCLYYCPIIPVSMWNEGDDLTEYLGVKLYEKPIAGNLVGRVKGNFPSFLRKTDQERIQNCLGELKYNLGFVKKEPYVVQTPEGPKEIEPKQPSLVGRKFQATLKVDGSSMTAYRAWLRDPETGEMYWGVGLCSRNLELKLDDDTNHFVRTFKDLDIETKLTKISEALGGRAIAIQGELMGPGVQGNREGLAKHAFYVFDIFDIEQREHLCPMTTHALAQSVGLDHVPQIVVAEFGEDISVDYFLNYAERPSINHKIAEGVVFKAVGEGPRYSFKVISNTFLLKEKD
jgi:tRNA-binding EMAP/Myf-like protein